MNINFIKQFEFLVIVGVVDCQFPRKQRRESDVFQRWFYNCTHCACKPTQQGKKKYSYPVFLTKAQARKPSFTFPDLCRQLNSCAMKASSFSSSSSRSPPQHKYDVFLSFHGKDTRKSFTDHLYAALVHRGIDTFKDDINLNRGENIESGLPKAIEESNISLVVFSKNYAESEWCLEELVKMMECSKRSHPQHTVLPIFYDVKPSEVREQKGSVADSLAKHQNCGPGVEKWRETLHEFANLSGFVLEDLCSG